MYGRVCSELIRLSEHYGGGLGLPPLAYMLSGQERQLSVESAIFSAQSFRIAVGTYLYVNVRSNRYSIFSRPGNDHIRPCAHSKINKQLWRLEQHCRAYSLIGRPYSLVQAEQ